MPYQEIRGRLGTKCKRLSVSWGFGRTGTWSRGGGYNIFSRV